MSPRRRKWLPIPVTLVLPAGPPTQDETCPERSRRIDAILIVTRSISQKKGVRP